LHEGFRRSHVTPQEGLDLHPLPVDVVPLEVAFSATSAVPQIEIVIRKIAMPTIARPRQKRTHRQKSGIGFIRERE
jgi:hypothetical protein